MCVLLCVFTACVLGEGVEMFSWLDGHSFILLFIFYENFVIVVCRLCAPGCRDPGSSPAHAAQVPLWNPSGQPS